MSPQALRIMLISLAFATGLMSVFAVIVIVTGRTSAPVIPTASAIGGPFQLVDHNGKPFTDADLKGKPHLVFFGFTHCPDVCPLITQRMAALRDSLQNEGEFGSAVRFASFTVDPERDTPAVLRAYASSFGVDDAQHWRFLTGEPEAVLSVINKGFYLNAARADEMAPDSTAAKAAGHAHDGEEHVHDMPASANGYMVGHSDRLVLIDHEGRVRGTYVSSDAEAMAELRRDLRVLVRSM